MIYRAERFYTTEGYKKTSKGSHRPWYELKKHNATARYSHANQRAEEERASSARFSMSRGKGRGPVVSSSRKGKGKDVAHDTSYGPAVVGNGLAIMDGL